MEVSSLRIIKVLYLIRCFQNKHICLQRLNRITSYHLFILLNIEQIPHSFAASISSLVIISSHCGAFSGIGIGVQPKN